MTTLMKYYQERAEMVYHKERLVNEIAMLERFDENTSDLWECIDLTDMKIKMLDDNHEEWIKKELDEICELMERTL